MQNKQEEELIEIPRSWLDGLLNLAEKSQGDKNKENMWLLIGYISSAKTIIKYLKKNGDQTKL